jgi:topoisomerase-4 subunit A
MRGHLALDSDLKFRDGDKGNIIFHAFSTDKILAIGSNGRCYTLLASSLPGGRGLGEPIRIVIELPNESEIVSLILLKPGQKELVASNTGNGFIIAHVDLQAQTRNGKQILNLKAGENLCVCTSVDGDYVASLGENGKLLVFSVMELPEMARGKGVRLQKFKTGGLSDAKVFSSSMGLSWQMTGGKTRIETNILDWEGKRATSGRNPPYGFPKTKKF